MGVWSEPEVIIDDAGNAATYNTGSWKTYKPIWDKEKCIHCLNCWIMCPDDCIKTEDGKMTGINLNLCKGCSICAAACPPKVSAIEMVLDNKSDEGE